MPKIGAHSIPNYDIEKVSSLIVETGQRINTVTAGDVPEDIFQEEYLQKAGGTYQSYRYSMEEYGFIYRSQGADTVELTELFEKVADPLQPGAREDAKTEAVQNVQLLVEMFQSDIGRTIGSEELRRQLVVELGTPKEEIEQKQLDRLRKLYEAAYPYLERGMSTQSQPQENERESDQTDAEEEGESGVAPSGESPSQPSGSENVIHIDGLTLQLEGDDVEDEWERAKATIDAYLTSDAS